MNKGKYDDIINMPHHISKKHPRMTLENRSAQFAPFAALTGYDDQIKETGRTTDRKIDITDEIKNDLNTKLQIIQEKINIKPEVTITYFIPDSKKEGGSYKTVNSNVLKIDKYKQKIILKGNNDVAISEIVGISL